MALRSSHFCLDPDGSLSWRESFSRCYFRYSFERLYSCIIKPEVLGGRVYDGISIPLAICPLLPLLSIKWVPWSVELYGILCQWARLDTLELPWKMMGKAQWKGHASVNILHKVKNPTSRLGSCKRPQETLHAPKQSELFCEKGICITEKLSAL